MAAQNKVRAIGSSEAHKREVMNQRKVRRAFAAPDRLNGRGSCCTCTNFQRLSGLNITRACFCLILASRRGNSRRNQSAPLPLVRACARLMRDEALFCRLQDQRNDRGHVRLEAGGKAQAVRHAFAAARHGVMRMQRFDMPCFKTEVSDGAVGVEPRF